MVELVCPAYIAKRYPPTIDCGVKKPPGAEVDQYGVEESFIVQYWPITVSFLRVYLYLACALFQDIIRGICVSRTLRNSRKCPEVPGEVPGVSGLMDFNHRNTQNRRPGVKI